MQLEHFVNIECVACLQFSIRIRILSSVCFCFERELEGRGGRYVKDVKEVNKDVEELQSVHNQ